MLALFWSSVGLILYTYLGYPLVLLALSLVRRRPVADRQGCLPRVSLIVTVFNESRRIRAKIANCLELEYPKDRLEIIFASDASTDDTDEIVKSFESQGITLVRSPRRAGKEYAQKCAIEQARGEILVFTDVATMLEPQGIRAIASNFADPSVGCVSSEDRFIDSNGVISGEGAYVRYEMWLRKLESRVNSVVGMSGSFFAARKEVCRNWPTNIPSDFNTLLNTIRAGLRGVSDPCSLGIYSNIKDESKEYDRKVRTITRGISALFENAELMNPARYGLFSWQLVSHKLLRWCVPWLLALAFVSNLALACAGRARYVAAFIMQIGFYLLASMPVLSRCGGAVKIPRYFVQVNLAIAAAWIKYMKGERFVTWTPSKR
ncbi:MAG: glycosyltransferase family 2 protein [Bacteriovoracaceae bacterium]|nr:glycosyltransferase family 2 protein [Bacteriovoracaceae bacterium]